MIKTKAQYDQITQLIETLLKKATDGGGFHSLSEAESNELEKLSLLAEQYEDTVLKIMPLPITINTL